MIKIYIEINFFKFSFSDIYELYFIINLKIKSYKYYIILEK